MRSSQNETHSNKTGLSQLTDVNAETRQPKGLLESGLSALESLPAEILLAVAEQLDYGSLKRLQ